MLDAGFGLPDPSQGHKKDVLTKSRYSEARFLVLLVLAGLALAGPVQFSGSASIYSEYEWVTGDSLVEPRPELRFNINPVLSLFGFPIGLDMLLSTHENPIRQQLDKCRLFLNPKQWLESQADLSGLALSFKSLELGSCNPSWTPYTLAGAPVLGGAVELNPWYLYAAAAAGRTQRRVPVSDSTQGASARMLYSGRFGFGRKEGTHFYLTALYAGDDTTPPANNWQPNPNDTQPPIDSFEVVRPQENYVLGAEFNLDLAKGAFRLESEVTGSELTRDKRLPVEKWDWMPGWAANTLKPRMSSSFDYAFRVKPSLNVLDTRVHGKLEFIGPGYQSLGAPGLRKDNMTIGAGIERSFFDNAVSASVVYSSHHDNLLSARDSAGNVLRLKSSTTRFSNLEASLSLAFPNVPYMQVGYYPYTQATDHLDSVGLIVSTSVTKGNVVSIGTGHSLQIGKVSHTPSLSLSYNDVRGPTNDSVDNTSWDTGMNYAIGFEFPLSFSVSAGYSRSTSVMAESDTRIYCDVAPSYTLFQKWNHSLSLGGTLGTATRTDVRYTTSFPVWKICDGRFDVSNAIYSGDDGRYNDMRLTAQLSKNW